MTKNVGIKYIKCESLLVVLVTWLTFNASLKYLSDYNRRNDGNVMNFDSIQTGEKRKKSRWKNWEIILMIKMKYCWTIRKKKEIYRNVNKSEIYWEGEQLCGWMLQKKKKKHQKKVNRIELENIKWPVGREK